MPAPRSRVNARQAYGRPLGGFTLIELLICVAIIATLISLLLPALGRGVASARNFRCQTNLRSITFDFSVFADPQLHSVRGNDIMDYGRNRFSLETFIESEYRIDEFWPREETANIVVTRASDPNLDPMRCPEVKGELTMRRNTPCRAGALSPTRNVAFGFNSRLFRAETTDSRGRTRLEEVLLTSDITTRGMVPLVWDVDGEQAEKLGVIASFSAPSLNSVGPYAGNQFWWPGTRHLGKGNFALIDGSVHAPSKPLAETTWQWSYQPRP